MLSASYAPEQNPELLCILFLESAEEFDDLVARGDIWFVKSHACAKI